MWSRIWIFLGYGYVSYTSNQIWILPALSIKNLVGSDLICLDFKNIFTKLYLKNQCLFMVLIEPNDLMGKWIIHFLLNLYSIVSKLRHMNPRKLIITYKRIKMISESKLYIERPTCYFIHLLSVCGRERRDIK